MTLPNLPKDLVEEVLSFVPATYLKRLSSTCKPWNRLIHNDKRFARKHSDNAAKEFLVFMLRRNFRICRLSFNLHGTDPSAEVKGELILPDPYFKNSADQFEIDRVFHCDGLLLCTSQLERRMVVWNPLTGETKWIQTRQEGGTFVLGYSQDKNKFRNKSYKIMGFYDRSSEFLEVYDFNSDSWRVLDGIRPEWYLGYAYRCVSLKGNAYMLGIDIIEEMGLSLSLLKYDFSTEKYEPVTLPFPSHAHCFREAHCLSVVRGEKLSLLYRRDKRSKTEVWVTNKIDDTTTEGAVSWTKVLALDLNRELQIAFTSNFLVDEEKKVFMCCVSWREDGDEDKSKDKVYMVGEDSKVKEIDSGVNATTGCWPTILGYVPSLVQIQQAGGKRERGD
ncbi:F-box associated interaction domain [Arabidopsis thaliana x Arabidopsis arenosa]|uniref:F-box associated interaction domain n=1 Tax=Arabidopsis thaliana x Arabidopsis arenosa TaxID=1240361 RepID=A0A8T2AWV1_9BRAS|nr:F-box associated interaction domain [Arabidopsis thaliana x Arabidopsis arenosa]